MKDILLSSMIGIGCVYTLYRNQKNINQGKNFDILKKNCSPISKLFLKKNL